MVIAGARPGVPLTLLLIGPLGQIHAARQVTLGTGENRELELSPAVAASRLVGRVVNADGEAVPTARVLIAAADPGLPVDTRPTNVVQISTDASGRFAFRDARTDSLDVVVQVPGYAPWSRSGIRAGRDAELEIALEYGRTVTLRVLDESGHPVTDADVRVQPPVGFFTAGAQLWEVRQRDDGYAIADLPAGPVTFVVPHAGQLLRVTSEDEVIEVRLD